MVWTVGRQAPLPPETETIGGFKAGYVRRDPLGKNDPYGRARRRGVQPRKFITTSDWLGRSRPIANQDNDYLIDRDLQKSMGTVFELPADRPGRHGAGDDGSDLRPHPGATGHLGPDDHPHPPQAAGLRSRVR